MIFTLIAMVVLLALAVALLRLTGAGVTDSARAVSVNQSQEAANVAIRQAISWLEAQDITGDGDDAYDDLAAALEARDPGSPAADRSAALGGSCYEWAFVEGEADTLYDPGDGTVTIRGRGVAPGELGTDGSCAARGGARTTTLVAKAKVAPSALGYALAGNGIYLGTQP